MSEATQQEILEARKKLAEKFGNTQIGGKGTQRRKHEVKKRGNKVETDKKIESIAKKSQAKKINEINEINIFKDDNTVIHFKKPTLEYSFKEKVSFVSGLHETKNIKELLPAIIKQLGPKQFDLMKEYAETIKTKDKKDDKNDEPPELVEDFESVSKKDDKKDKKEKKKEKKAAKKAEKEEKKEEEKKEEEKKEEEKTEEEKKEEEKKE
jgi:nascent polypeptide-associated complex subunit beta